ncbi:hypothetical protein, partial [Pseudomonas sp. CG7]|uniref:hypothetical protein n=1 Tax=Pseudomonas sp. CG7 TaxID=191007 RepID=UPI00203455DF
VVIGFVRAMVKGGPGSVQLPFAGFGRLSNGKTADWMVAIPCGSELARDGGLTVLAEYISIPAVTAANGSALTAGHF